MMHHEHLSCLLTFLQDKLYASVRLVCELTVYPGSRGDLWRERGAKRGRGKIASGRIHWKSHFHAKPKYRN